MRPDGSTIQIRAAEPREFVQLPVDLKALTEEERRHRLAARKLKVKQIKEDIIDDNFDMDRYAQLWKSKDELKAQSKLRSSNEDAKTSKNKMAEKNSMKKTAGEAVDEGAENKTVEKQMRVEKSRVGAKKNS
ncbi:unnamed protein product [Toxocara canis]|uniref:SFM domain-containing protein n=1 Tax=Toxocara canis TaxID=6265 RepID=A0A183VCJ8_TOXCA|nr:unnamed protein product [Toxocara canis]